MDTEQIELLFKRLDKLQEAKTPLFGQMNTNQMICHCADQIRLALGIFEAEEYGKMKPEEVIALSKLGEPVPTAKGLGQVEGGGTKPTTFKDDVKVLKQHIIEFSKIGEDFKFGLHPYFGSMSKEKWIRLTKYHLNHHFNQFGL